MDKGNRRKAEIKHNFASLLTVALLIFAIWYVLH